MADGDGRRAVSAEPASGRGRGRLTVTEVSGFTGTFLEALDAEKVPPPPLMGYTDWLKYRKGEGLRPTKDRDGVTHETALEARLWRLVMSTLFGEDWQEQLRRQGAPVPPQAAPSAQALQRRQE